MDIIHIARRKLILLCATPANFKSTLFCGPIQLFSCQISFSMWVLCSNSGLWRVKNMRNIFIIKFSSVQDRDNINSTNPVKTVCYFICGCPGPISSSELYQVKGLSWQASPLSPSKHLKHIQQIPTIKLLDIFKQILPTLGSVSVEYN